MKSKEFPYNKYQAVPAWDVIDSAIEQLVKNNDLVTTTDRRYIVGFLLKQLDVNKLLKEKSSR